MIAYVVPTIVGLMYAAQGTYHVAKGEYGYALMWFAYAFANVGICISMIEGADSAAH